MRPLVGAALAVMLLGLGAVAWQELRYARPHRELAAALHAVQLSVERYGVDHLRGSYPARLEELLGTPYMLKLPENPYGPGPLILQQPGDPPRPGGVVYVAEGPAITDAGGAVRKEYDRYIILGYGNRVTSRSAPQYLPDRELGAEIDWSRVAVSLSSGLRQIKRPEHFEP